MKAITLWQPWASFIPMGIKTYETRGWDTKHRGELAIHSAKTPKGFNHGNMELFSDTIKNREDFPLGKVLCIVNLIDTFLVESIRDNIGINEYYAGDYSSGPKQRYAWRLGIVKIFTEPIPAKGNQGFWNWEEK